MYIIYKLDKSKSQIEVINVCSEITSMDTTILKYIIDFIRVNNEIDKEDLFCIDDFMLDQNDQPKNMDSKFYFKKIDSTNFDIYVKNTEVTSGWIWGVTETTSLINVFKISYTHYDPSASDLNKINYTYYGTNMDIKYGTLERRSVTNELKNKIERRRPLDINKIDEYVNQQKAKSSADLTNDEFFRRIKSIKNVSCEEQDVEEEW